MMKKLWIAVGAAVVLAGGGYGLYDYYAGNHVEVKQVISTEVNGEADVSGSKVGADDLNGSWIVQEGSEVYFSVTTSKETVNFAIPAVTGTWQFDASDPAKMAAQGTADLMKLDSGNGRRDDHIKGADYLKADEFPEAKFTVTSFGEVPSEWQEGVKVPLTMTGTLEVKGMTKDVTFQSEAVYEQEQLKLQGKSEVTFADFGLKNPHTVVLDTENNITLQLSLVFKKGV